MDEKRRLREEKREVKKSGTRRLRRYLKDPNSEPDDFDYGRKRSAVMNTPRPAPKPARENQPAANGPEPFNADPSGANPNGAEPTGAEPTGAEPFGIEH
jgi:hypothetical protein